MLLINGTTILKGGYDFWQMNIREDRWQFTKYLGWKCNSISGRVWRWERKGMDYGGV